MVQVLYENSWKVYVNGVYDPELAVRKVVRSVGAKAIQSAVFSWKDAGTNSQSRNYSIHEDLDCRTFFSNNTGDPPVDPKHIIVTRFDADNAEKVVHIGKLVSAKLSMGPSGEEIVFTSRLDHHLLSDYGYPVSHSWTMSYLTTYLDSVVNSYWDSGSITDQEAILNPVIDGIPRMNCYLKDEVDPVDVYPKPFDIDAVPTNWVDPVKAPPEVKWWTMADAICYLTKMYNSDEKVVTNPTHEQLVAWLGTDETLIRNFRVKRGVYIPTLIDRLVTPYGYSWAYSYGDKAAKPSFYFWKRNSPPPGGTGTTIPLQRFGEDVEVDHKQLKWSECESYNIQYDAYSRSTSVVEVYGGFQSFEITVELVPAWDPDHDGASQADLIEGSEAMIADPTLKRVLRDWVLNEGGDYGEFAKHSSRETGPYEEGLAYPYNFTMFDPSGAYDTLPKRRKFEKMLTIPENDKKSSTYGYYSGIQVMIWDPTKAKWVPPGELDMDVQILKDECGIRFGKSSSAPTHISHIFRPTQLDPNDSMRVQVTAVVQSDVRVAATAVSLETLSGGKRTMIDAGSGYAYKVVDPSSIYSGKPSYRARSHDASADVQGLADRVLEAWNAATVTGSITLIGTEVVGDYLGWEIRGFQERNLIISATHADLLPNEINPSVVAVTYDIPSNRTMLSLEAIRQDLRRV